MKNLTVVQVAKKFPVLPRNLKVIVAFTRFRQRTLC
jgi:hypothetical protein